MLNAHGGDCAQEATPDNSGISNIASITTERKERRPCKCFLDMPLTLDPEIQYLCCTQLAIGGCSFRKQLFGKNSSLLLMSFGEAGAGYDRTGRRFIESTAQGRVPIPMHIVGNRSPQKRIRGQACRFYVVKSEGNGWHYSVAPCRQTGKCLVIQAATNALDSAFGLEAGNICAESAHLHINLHNTWTTSGDRVSLV